MKPLKTGRMRGEYRFPEGLQYSPDFISPSEGIELMKRIEPLVFQEVRIFNQVAKRTVVHFGYTYDYERVRVEPGEPFPEFLIELSKKCASLAGIPHENIIQCLISHYPPEATIGWHRDKLLFGPQVIGISLMTACIMRFQSTQAGKRYVYEQILEPRSAYILSGEARYKWAHSIPAVSETRYSITFRTNK